MSELAKKIRNAVWGCLDNRKGLGIEENCNFDDDIVAEVREDLEKRIDRVLAVEVPNNNISREPDHECG